MTPLIPMFNRKKALGQNFLRNSQIAEKLVSVLEVPTGGTVLEVGPGRGILTQKLVTKGYRVIAVEVDSNLSEYIKEKFREKVYLLREDILELDLSELQKTFDINGVISNLPYSISTTFVKKIILEQPEIQKYVLMFQKEVGEKLLSPAGSRETGPYSIALQELFIVEKLFTVGPGAFSPPPSVYSLVLKLTMKNDIEIGNGENFLKFLFFLFSVRRKKIRRKFASLLGRCEIERLLEKRPEELTSNEILELYSCRNRFNP